MYSQTTRRVFRKLSIEGNILKKCTASAENTWCPQMSVFLCPIHKDTKISWHFQGVNSHLHFGAWPFRGLTFILHLIGWRGGSTLTSSALPTYPLFSLSLSIKDSALRAAWKTLRGFWSILRPQKGTNLEFMAFLLTRKSFSTQLHVVWANQADCAAPTPTHSHTTPCAAEDVDNNVRRISPWNFSGLSPWCLVLIKFREGEMHSVHSVSYDS